MIKYKPIEYLAIDKIICDRCKKEITSDIELQEVHMIDFIGGYGSIFGDMVNVKCDLCQHCLKELIGDFCICS